MPKDGSGAAGDVAGPKPSRGQKMKVRRQGRRRSDGEQPPVDREGHTRVGAGHGPDAPPAPASRLTPELTDDERALLGDLLAVIAEHSDDGMRPIDTEAVERAFAFACERHADQRRRSGEDFITHPVEVAKICAGLRLDTETLCAALLHDTVEDTSASLDEVQGQFGETDRAARRRRHQAHGITFQSRDESQAENYRKMMVAMATDVRVILIKLADRLHNMRTISALPSRSRSRKRARRSRSTRRWRTGWGSTRSSGSSRTSRSSACIRASTTRSRSSSLSSAPSASTTSRRPASS